MEGGNEGWREEGAREGGRDIWREGGNKGGRQGQSVTLVCACA